MTQWDDIPWSEISTKVIEMQDTIDVFSRDCMKLPPGLKDKQAYRDLKKIIDDMTEVLPLVQALAKPSIRDRHWEDIMELSKNKNIPYNQENFVLKHIFDANLLEIQDDVEEITDSADKQLRLEKQLKTEISAFWDDCELDVTSISGREDPCVIGGTIQEIQEKLEEHQMALAQMNAMKYVKPFKADVVEKMNLLSETSDTIEKWLKVQVSW